MTRPSASSAGGTRVVLPAPGEAITTAARDRLTVSRIGSRNGSIGRTGIPGLIARAPELLQPCVAAAADAVHAVLDRVRLVEMLVILLATPERRRRQNLRHHALETMRLHERILRLFGEPLLRVVRVKDDRPILCAV